MHKILAPCFLYDRFQNPVRKKFQPLLRISPLLALILMFFTFSFPGRTWGAVPPIYNWHTFYGASQNSEVYGIARDSNGNIYITGYSQAGWTGPGGEAPIHGHSGGQDIVVLKLDGAGTYLWHTFYGSASTDWGFDIGLDGSNNVYVTGRSDATWQGAQNIDPINPHAGMRDAVVVKFDTNGAYQWHTFHGGWEWDEARKISVDGNGNAHVVGYSNVNWGPSPIRPHSVDIAVPRQDMFIFKLNSSGLLQWNTFWGSAVPADGSDPHTGVDVGYGITMDGSGNLYISGQSYNTWQGGDGSVSPLHTHAGNYDIVVLKLNNDGVYQWHTFYGSAASDGGFAITADGNGTVYSTGRSEASWQGNGATDPLHSHSGSFDAFVLKLDGSGTYGWHTFYGSGVQDQGWAITRDGKGGVFVAGGSSSVWLGDGGAAALHPFSSGSVGTNLFILKLNEGGLYAFHTFYPDWGYGVNADGNGNIFCAGRSFDPWLGDGDVHPLHAHSGAGISNLLVIKLGTAQLYLPLILSDRAL